MTPLNGFQEFSNFILHWRDTGHRDLEDTIDFAARSVGAEERAASVAYLKAALAGDDARLLEAWSRSNGRIGPIGVRGLRLFTAMVIARIQDPTLPKSGDFILS